MHGVADILRFRLLMIAAGYEDGNDADALRHDPVFKLALDRPPDGAARCSQPTISRLENLPGTRALLRMGRAMGRAMVALYCASFRQVPRRIVLDLDDTFDAVHGGQQLRLFNAHYDDYGFQPIVGFDGEGRPVTAMLRPARRPTGAEVRACLRRLVRAIRAPWPRVEILIRADSHYCAPELRPRGARLLPRRAPGLHPRRGLDQHAAPPRRGAGAEHRRTLRGGTDRRQAAPLQGVLRRRRQLAPGRAHHRPRRGRRSGHRYPLRRHQSPRRLSAHDLRGSCERGQAENHIKAWKRHLAADRTSCTRATANQLRLFLHLGAYWLMWSLRSVMPKRSTWRVAQFDTLRLRLVKLAARVVELKTRVMLHLPCACPDQAILRLVLERLPRLVT